MPPASASRLPRVHLAMGASSATQEICFALSKREPTMRPASQSRASSATQEICFALSNREPDLLEPELSHCKQTQPVVSNRELSTVCNSAILSKKPPQNAKNPVNIYKLSRLLLTGTAPQTEFDVTSRKQSPKKFLTGARTSFSNRETQLSTALSIPGFVPHDTHSRPPIPGAIEAGLNRQIHGLELSVTYRKQKTASCTNRQKIKKCPNVLLARFPLYEAPPRSLDAPTENEF